ncbi:MAG: hypothetical protein EOO07_32385 [Chitinophagaceae bacterium]|nr:MAG: hypothetical protein EOO07_32385 [Chitinophagaceae bacterium]
MLKKHLLFTITYLIVLGLNVFATAFNNEVLKMVAMPLIGMSSILYLVIMTRLKNTFSIKVFFSLMFAMGGDVMLMFNTGTEFLFLIAIIATFSGYVLIVLSCYEDWSERALLHIKPVLYINILLFAVGLAYYFYLSKYLGEYKIPVIIHFFILLLLPISASLRYRKVNSRSFRLIIGSVICFSLSDYSIAYNSFIHEHTFLMVLYILAYLMAQYMLVIGTIERKVFKSR